MGMYIYVIIILMTFLGALASTFLKKASANESLKNTILSYNLYIGGGLYIICALLNIYVLKFLPYSVVLPLTSITYIWTLLLARICFKERISLRKVIGIAIIFIGSILII
ncbi:EamA family transporter [uncultured Bacteroides sp.]|uniref:EamA family transporter n=1 Tax=uncultured Bacteroides sp. TaxID=162156 RepID=UPI0033901112